MLQRDTHKTRNTCGLTDDVQALCTDIDQQYSHLALQMMTTAAMTTMVAMTIMAVMMTMIDDRKY